MGFTNEAKGGSGKFANFKDGLIVTKIDGEKKTFTHLTGRIIGVWVEPAKYQDKEYTKVNVTIKHEDGETILGFPLSSGYGNAFCRLLPRIDIKKDVKISGGTQPDKTDPLKKYASLFIDQSGETLKWFYSKAGGNDDKVPAVKEVPVGTGKNKKMVKDYSAREDFFERLILKFDQNLEKEYGKKQIPVTADDVTEPIDDLPF
jgi:hypothetical protein